MCIDRAREISDDDQINNIRDINTFMYECVECQDNFLFESMRHTDLINNSGVCNDCSVIPEVAYSWGFDDE